MQNYLFFLIKQILFILFFIFLCALRGCGALISNPSPVLQFSSTPWAYELGELILLERFRLRYFLSLLLSVQQSFFIHSYGLKELTEISGESLFVFLLFITAANKQQH